MAVGLIVAGAVLVAATLAGFAWRALSGRLRKGRQQYLIPSQLGQPLGTRATLLQFSSAFCAPCRATRQLLADVASDGPGIAHIELDVADRLDLVRLLDVRRTPTVLVLGPQGQIARRASGLVRRADVIAAVAQAAGEPVPAAGEPVPAAGKLAPTETPAPSLTRHVDVEQPKPIQPGGSDSGHGRA